jgi:nitrogen-specific signal transduction histidine kinase
MEREVHRIGGAVNELEHFAKPRRPKKNKVSINSVVEKAIQAACTDSRNECPVTYQALGARDEAVLDPEQIALALAAVIRILKENADDEDGSVGVVISHFEEERFVITIEGRNTLSLGEEVHNAFVPLYLRNIVRFGHEIGVAAAYGIVGAHKGTIRIETIPQGTRFLISLPKA